MSIYWNDLARVSRSVTLQTRPLWHENTTEAKILDDKLVGGSKCGYSIKQQLACLNDKSPYPAEMPFIQALPYKYEYERQF
eukprot:scaffold225851_cov31-Prasinocladus_malaysianus.AAC.2